MTIYNPCPLPLLAPYVDLRSVSSVGSNSITRGLYRSLIHAFGVRRRSGANNSLFTTTTNFCSNNAFGLFQFCRSSSFSGYASGFCATCTGLPTSGVASTQSGSCYFVQGSVADWATQNSSTTTTSAFLGASYSCIITSLESIFAGFEYRSSASTSLMPSSGVNQSKLTLTPWDWSPHDEVTINATLNRADYDLVPVGKTSTGAYLYRPIWFAPKSPLLETPKLIEETRVDQLVSIGGRSYRRSYSPRRIYEVRLLLDGATRGANVEDPMLLWKKFLFFADAGVTLWIDREWLCNFWRPYFSVVCPNMPNEISGTLLDASSLTFSPRDGIPDAYEVTIQIADQTGAAGMLEGEVPTL